MTLHALNTLDADAATAEFARCCGARRWAAPMAALRPFSTLAAVYAAAEALWPLLTPADWREAFAHHPPIGDRSSLRARFADTRAWAAEEQQSTEAAGDAVLDALAAGNMAYQQRFGYIFIVCATGKGAAEMLALLQARLPKSPQDEMPRAAAEQQKITRLRLQKLLAEGE